MPRLPRKYPAAPYGAGLLAAACAVLFGCAPAMAQTAAPVYADPLAPKLTADPRNPPRFQKVEWPVVAQAGSPATFTPPAAGAGDTGFDSTNARKPPRKAKAKPKVTAPAAIAGSGSYAAAPGAPPVAFGPIVKPPPKRKAHSEPDDPYAPLGLHAGSFTLFPAVELIGGYDTNPERGPNGKGGKVYTVAPELRTQSNWSRHEFKSELRGSYTGYSPDSEPTLSRPYVNGKADGRVDVTKDTRIDLGGRVLVSTDNPGSPNLPAGLAKLPLYATYGGSAGVGYRFNRFDLSIKGDAERTVYQDSSLIGGTTASNEDRNFNQYGAILRGSYEMTPGLTPFVEVGADKRVHDLAVDFSGYRRDSNGLTGKVGSTFELSNMLRGEASLGYTRRNYDDERLAGLAGLIGNASLIWTANALTTVKLTAKSSVGESTTPGVSGVLYRDVGLQVDHSFRRWLIGSAKIGFGLDDYVGLEREDKRYSAGLGLTYKLDRTTQIKGEVRQEWLRSNVTGSDYTASIFMLGLRFQQ